jgi:hypothetical protein
VTDIFISYASEDRSIAEALAANLGVDGWKIFWDRRIGAGANWNEEIQRELYDARCVLVLWSAVSRNSFWVAAEAANAFERDTFVPVRIDESEPPRLFRQAQSQSIAKWVKQKDTDELDQLKSSIMSRIGPLPMYGNLEQVADGGPVQESHLHLVHSCWRVNKRTSFGLMPYQIHVIVYGHPSALARVESVEYRLPGYPPGHDHQPGGPPERLFELKELANGFSIVQALLRVRQPPGHPRILRLSRFINMSDSGPRLFDDFIRRRSPNIRN